MGVVRRLNSTFSLSYQVSLIRYKANPICTCSLALVYMAWYAVAHACCPYPTNISGQKLIWMASFMLPLGCLLYTSPSPRD